MPTNQELAVILKLRDELSDAFRQTVQRVDEGMKTLSHRMKEIGSTAKEVGRNMLQLGLEITGPFLGALAVASSVSLGASLALTDLKVSFRDLSVIVSNAILPLIQQLADLVRRLVGHLQNMDPQVRDMALRFMFLTGVLLTLNGLILKLAGQILKLGGFLVGLLAALSPVQLAVIAAAAAVIGLLAATDLLNPALTLLARLLDFVANAGAQLIEVVLLPMRLAFLGMVESVQLFLELLSKLPDALGGRKVREIARSFGAFRDEVGRSVVEGAQRANQFGQQAMDALAGKGRGAGAPFQSALNNVRSFIQEFKKLLSPGQGAGIAQGFMASFRDSFQQFVKESLDFGRFFANSFIGFFRNMESGIARSVENVILHGGKFKNFLKDLGRTIVQSFVSMVSQLIAHILVWLPILLLLNAIPGGSFILKALDLSSSFIGPTLSAAKASAQTKHSGGIIQRFQTGGEVLAMLEPGEFVVNRRATEQNRELLEGINSGRGVRSAGGQNLAVVFNINAIDPRSGTEFLLRNSKTIADAVGQEILRNNQPFRRISRRFA